MAAGSRALPRTPEKKSGDRRGADDAAPPSILRRLLLRSKFYRLLTGFGAPEEEPIVLRQSRVYVLPTLHGVTFGLAIVLMLLGSINYSLSLGFLLTFLLAGMTLVAMVHTFRNLAQLSIRAGRSEPVFAGNEATFALQLENPTRHDRFTIVALRGGHSAVVDAARGETVSARIAAPALRRGRMRAGRLTLETRYPLGLFRAWSYIEPDLSVLVYPRPDNFPLPRDTALPDAGNAVNLGFGSDDFAGLRDYQRGDSPRHIAWKSAARGDNLVVKQWSGRGAAELWLDWATLSPQLGVEERLCRLTGWVVAADGSQRIYGLRLPGVEIPPDRGAAHRERCLEALALYDVAASPPASLPAA